MVKRCPVCAGMPSGMGIYPQHTYDSSCKATSPTEILLAPHNDDESLFAAYTCLRHKPVVAVCFQAADRGVREAETREACRILGVEFQQWLVPDTSSLNDARDDLRGQIRGLGLAYDACYAPAWEMEGHEQHNLVAELAHEEFGDVVTYLTYRRGFRRSRGTPVPYEPHWPGLKLKAMACYQSQINLPVTQPWFTDDWLNEWVA